MNLFQQLCLWHYFDYPEDLHISSSLFYYRFVIDTAKPTSLVCVNSNIYSCILPLLKLGGTFWFMTWLCCIYLILTYFVLMKYANLFDFWFDKRQRYLIFTYAQFRWFDCELWKLILFYFYQVLCWGKLVNLQKFCGRYTKVFVGILIFLVFFKVRHSVLVAWRN